MVADRSAAAVHNASYLDTEITRGCCFQDTTDPRARRPARMSWTASGAQTLVGNNLPNAPEVKYTLGANYTLNWAPGSLTFGGTYSYTDDLQSNVFSIRSRAPMPTRSPTSASCGTTRRIVTRSSGS